MEDIVEICGNGSSFLGKKEMKDEYQLQKRSKDISGELWKYKDRRIQTMRKRFQTKEKEDRRNNTSEPDARVYSWLEDV